MASMPPPYQPSRRAAAPLFKNSAPRPNTRPPTKLAPRECATTAGQRRGGSRALVKDRPQLLPEALAEAQTLRRGAARSRSCAPTTRQLAPAVPRPFPHKPSEDASLRRQEYHNQTPRSLSCVTHPETPRPSRAARRDLEYGRLPAKVSGRCAAVPKDAETLQALIDPAMFVGILISDDAAVYANFTAAQKCWAHLLRKAIKLTLQAPNDPDYRTFADRLLEIYRSACRVQRDGRLSDAGRARQVAALDDEVLELCAPVWVAELPKLAEETEDNYRLLVQEVMRLMLAKELFTFVTAAPVTQPNGTRQPVAGTNNEVERTLRGAAQARDTGRTNKTLAGARRQTIVVSVLESLRLYLPCFTLGSVVAEVERWLKTGRSCYQKLLLKLKLSVAARPVLDRVLPQPDS